MTPTLFFASSGNVALITFQEKGEAMAIAVNWCRGETPEDMQQAQDWVLKALSSRIAPDAHVSTYQSETQVDHEAAIKAFLSADTRHGNDVSGISRHGKVGEAEPAA